MQSHIIIRYFSKILGFSLVRLEATKNMVCITVLQTFDQHVLDKLFVRCGLLNFDGTDSLGKCEQPVLSKKT